MSKLKDETGHIYGNLTVLSRAEQRIIVKGRQCGIVYALVERLLWYLENILEVVIPLHVDVK